MNRDSILSDLSLKLNWIQKNTSYILAGIFESKEEPRECVVLVIPDIHKMIEGESFIEEEFITVIGKINILDVRCLKQYYKGEFFNLDSIDKDRLIVLNPFVNSVLKANIDYKKSQKSIKAMQDTERKIKNIIHQMIYDDILKRDIANYQMMKENNNQTIRK